MSKGRLTIPTDESFVEGTKKYVKKWGADAVRDCDGTELPDNVGELAEKVYKTYFLVRNDNDYAYSHDDEIQNIALITDRKTAFSNVLKIDLLEGLYKEQVSVNTFEYKKYWQVFDRTEGKEVFDWEYEGNDIVVIKNAVPMHEYTVNFFGNSLWDPTQIYNYTCNGWTKVKDRDIDPIHPNALKQILDNLDKWLKENPQINVVRFTTFFYHFFLMYKTGTTQKLFDWYNYAMAASPAMFELFEKEYGYKITLEDVVNGGDYSNLFVIPSKPMADFTDLVQRFVSKTLALIVDKVHKAGKEAMMFWGDNWIGAEPYGKYFKEIGLDAVVGSVSSGVNVRIVSEIPGLKYNEIRLMPYFFPDTLAEDKQATEALLKNWVVERRAIMRKPVDRIGFGGYLAIADKFPGFCDAVENLTNEFRTIYDTVDNKQPYCSLRIAVLSYWGKEKSWMMHNVCQDAPYQKTLPYIGVEEALVGLPLQVDFINFDDVLNGDLSKYDVIMNYGSSGNAFTGDYFWKNAKIVEKIKQYVANGGGFIGMGQPASVQYQGKFFQISDVLGVDQERDFTLMFRRYNTQKTGEHFITEDVSEEIDYAGGVDNVYALDGAVVLDAKYESVLPQGMDNCHVKMAVNSFGCGRSFYMAGMRYNARNTRLLYRALLWTAGKEHLLQKAFSTNVNTECHYYPASETYAIVNNTNERQETVFFDIDGKQKTVVLKGNEILWIKK